MYCYPLPQEYLLSSPFGNRISPINGTLQFHDGNDLACPQGTPILAFDTGLVVIATKDQFKANWIDIQHENNLKTRYLHLSRIDVVQGQTVQIGQQIGLSGGTPGTDGAGLSVGPHLHFGTFTNNQATDPQPFLNESTKQNQIKLPMTDELKTYTIQTLRSYIDLSSATLPDGLNFTDIETLINNDHVDQGLALILDSLRGKEKEIQDLIINRNNLWAELDQLKKPTI